MLTANHYSQTRKKWNSPIGQNCNPFGHVAWRAKQGNKGKELTRETREITLNFKNEYFHAAGRSLAELGQAAFGENCVVH